MGYRNEFVCEKYLAQTRPFSPLSPFSPRLAYLGGLMRRERYGDLGEDLAKTKNDVVQLDALILQYL